MTTPRRTFVRGIWGAPDGMAPQPKFESKTMREVRQSTERALPSPIITYAFGRANSELLKSCGIEHTVLSDEPLVNWTKSSGTRDITEGPMKGRLAWGLSLWRHKLECMREALKTHDEIIWMDFDVKMSKPLTSDFWERMGRGQPIQAALRQYRLPHCNWRIRLDKRKICHGAFVYLRSMPILERVIEVHETLLPKCVDEIAYSYVTDELMGGWKGSEAYRDLGYHPFCFANRLTIHPPEPKEIIFTEGYLRMAYHLNKLHRGRSSLNL